MKAFFSANKSKFATFPLFKFNRKKTVAFALISTGALAATVDNRPIGMGDDRVESIFHPAFTLFRHLRTISVVSRIVLDYHFTLNASSAEHEKSKLHLRSAQALLKLFKYNGGIYIKLGQHLSSLVYLIPDEYTSTLHELLDHCPSCTIQDVKMVFRKETGLETNTFFDWIDPIPVGTASLAAVYKGSWKGQLVAIKIQHYYLDRQASLDIHTCAVLGRIVKYLIPAFQFDWLVEEMATNLPKEMDFRIEKDNAEKCQKNFNTYSGLVIPKVFLATRRVLLMEFIDGGKVSDLAYLSDKGINPRQVSRRIGQVFLDMIFEHQFLHCDPHSGKPYQVAL